MRMDFKEKVKLHNAGEYDLSGELLTLARSSDCVTTTMVSTEHTRSFWNEIDGHYKLTFTRWRPKYKPKEHTFEYRLAHNFRTILTRHAKPANSIRKRKWMGGDNHEIHDFDPLGFIYLTLKGIGHELYKDDFLDLTPAMLEAVEDKYGFDHYDSFVHEIVDFVEILHRVNRAKEGYFDEITPLMIEALNESLLLVDVNRSDDHIVAYIAKGVRFGTYNRLNKLYGSHTFDRGGEKYYVLEDDMDFTGTDIFIGHKDKLTKSQSEFIKTLNELIQKEMDKKNVKVFAFDKDGQLIDFEKRYFAGLMGIEESNFKHRIRKINKKA